MWLPAPDLWAADFCKSLGGEDARRVKGGKEWVPLNESKQHVLSDFGRRGLEKNPMVA